MFFDQLHMRPPLLRREELAEHGLRHRDQRIVQPGTLVIGMQQQLDAVVGGVEDAVTGDNAIADQVLVEIAPHGCCGGV